RVPEPDADWETLRLQLSSADAEVLPTIGFHPDLVPQVLAVKAGEADVVIGISAPGFAALVVRDLAADLLDFAILLLEPLNKAGETRQMFLEQVRPTEAAEHDQVVPGPRCNLRRGAGRQFEVWNVIDGDGDAVLLAPLPREAVEPGIELGYEMAPLEEPQCLGLSQGGRHERRREHRRQPDSGDDARCPQKFSSRHGTFLFVPCRFHRTALRFGDADADGS